MATRKLLLADDSVTIQKVVNLTFADEGMEVTAFGDGDSAVENLEAVMPDIVLADIHMPGLSGYQVCEQIKQNPRFQHIPVILLVGSFEPFDEDEAKRSGADDYLTKPFQSIRQLVSRVNALIPQQSAQQVEDDYFLRDTSETVALDSSMVSGQSSYGVEQPTVADWAVTTAPTETFDDSEIEDELLEATPVSKADFSPETTMVNTLPRATTRLSAEEVNELNLYNSTLYSKPETTIPEPPITEPIVQEEQVVEPTLQEERIEETVATSTQDLFEIAPPPVEMTPPPVEEEDVLDMTTETPAEETVEEVVEKVIQEPVLSFAVEPTVTATAPTSPYATTPLSEDALLDLGYEDGVSAVGKTDDSDDFVLDLDEDETSTFATAPYTDVAEVKTSELVDEVKPTVSTVEETASFTKATPFEWETQVSKPVEEIQEQGFELVAPVAQDTIAIETKVEEIKPTETVEETVETAYTSTAQVAVTTEPAVEEILVTQETESRVEEVSPIEEPLTTTVGAEPQVTMTTAVTPMVMNAGSLSSETIDAIARRVVEMMSDKAVQEIAWEVVPELADLHIRRKLQEKNL